LGDGFALDANPGLVTNVATGIIRCLPVLVSGTMTLMFRHAHLTTPAAAGAFERAFDGLER
jgi:hypothetical protein